MRKRTFILKLCILLMSFTLFPQFIYAHTHNESCYASNIHSHNGDEINGGGCYQTPMYHTHIDTCYELDCASANVTSNIAMGGEYQCPNSSCRKNTDPTNFGSSPSSVVNMSCDSCGATATKTYCGHCGTLLSGSDTFPHNGMSLETAKAKNNTKCGLEGQVDRYGLSCSLTENTNYGDLICSQEVVRIVAENQTQSGTLNTNVIVTYMDEHTEVKQATSNYDKNKTYESEIITLTFGEHTTDIVFSSIGNTEEIILIDETTTDTFIKEEEPVDIIVKEEEIVNIDGKTPIKDENPKLKDETGVSIEDFKTEKGPNIKDTIVMDLEEEVEIVKDENSLNKKTNAMPFIVLGVIGAGVGVVAFALRNKKFKINKDYNSDKKEKKEKEKIRKEKDK